jgi:hypothetical protein
LYSQEGAGDWTADVGLQGSEGKKGPPGRITVLVSNKSAHPVSNRDTRKNIRAPRVW